MRSFRTIYMVEKLSKDVFGNYDIAIRRFACNKAIAEKIARKISKYANDEVDEIHVTKLSKWEWQFVNMLEVER